MRSTNPAALLLLACLSVNALALEGCFSTRRVATPAELEQLGTRKYPGKSREEVMKATVTALRLQGYEVVTTDPRIRTAPKAVATSAYGGYGRAQSFTESVAWDIEVEGDDSSAVLHATPRASVNGEPMEQVYYEWAERTFRELMKEIDASLSSKSAWLRQGASVRG
ncbi:MAG: hypothetical protein ACOY0T_16425 [Myxococcota bacterium]